MRLKELRKDKKLSQKELATILQVAQNTISQWERGAREPDINAIQKLANFFNVSTDYLLGYSEVTVKDSGVTKNTAQVSESNPLPQLNAKNERDIARDLEKIMSNLDSENALAFYGEPLNEEDRELLRISLENSMRIATQIAKQKYTPKKYRK